MTLRQTPLIDQHIAMGASTADFGGWDMPIEYEGTLSEHKAVREAVAMFDVSHMGTTLIFGPGALDALNGVLTNDLERITDGQAQYTLLCDADGGVVDDLIAYRINDANIMLIPNAANSDAVVAAVSAALTPQGITVMDARDDHGIIAVQGPESSRALAAIGLDQPENYMSFIRSTWRELPVMVCRTGYTGEPGFEIVAPNAALVPLWRELAAQGVIPAGLGARDTLRTEMGYPLHGNELGADITPVQAGLAWAVGWQKQDFNGAEVLRQERETGPTRRLRGLIAAGRGIPRPGMSILDASGQLIGIVTSGTYSPTLARGIGLGFLPPDTPDQMEVFVDVRGRLISFTVCKPPFVDSHVR